MIVSQISKIKIICFDQKKIMPLRLVKKNLSNQETQNENVCGTYQSGVKQIQRMIKPQTHLWLEKSCVCTVCQEQKPLINQKKHHGLQFKESSKKGHEWLKTILSGLTEKGTKTLKLFLPDVLFLSGQGLEIFSTNKKDYRIMKYAGTTPVKALVNTMTRLRKQYKSMLQQSYKKTLIDKLDPKMIHVKYFDKLVPSHFNDADDSTTLSSNKSTFRSYILHDNPKLIIPSIEQHKMNDKQPFAIIRYAQGNYQLLNQKEFEIFSIMKLPEDVMFVQSYVKAKEGDGVVMSEYNIDVNVDERLWKRAEMYVMVLMGGVGRYDEGYENLENFEDEADEMMKHNPQQCAKLLTYQLIHFLSISSKLYITHIKLKWVINDIDNLYLQQVIQFQTEQIPKRHIKYKLPPTTSQIQNFYSDQQFFLHVHSELKRKKEENVGMIKKRLLKESYEDITGRGLKQSARKNSNIIDRGEMMLISGDQSDKIDNSTILKSNRFKRVNVKNKQTISIMDNQSFINKRASIDTKDTTLLQSSRKYRTIIPVKKTELFNKNVSTIYNPRQNISKQSRRSQSLFGDMITRYQQKMINRQTRRMNNSSNQYETAKSDRLKKQNFQQFMSPHSGRNLIVSIQFS